MAQAQVQRQANITHNESLELVRCLLRVSVFHISYLRGLFPDDHFKGVDMKNLDNMHIKMLNATCPEARQLIDWVEGGVYDAIKRGYAKTLFFGISTDKDGLHLLEEYVFNFSFGDNGTVAMDMQQHHGNTSKNVGNFAAQPKVKADTVNGVKYQVTRLMRMLVQICQTLDKVPQERFLFMKLTYYDHCPDGYEPPFFMGVDSETAGGHFARKPFTMEVGNVATSHHGVTMKVKSTLDACDGGDDEGGPEPELCESADNDDDLTTRHTTVPDGAGGGAGQVVSSQDPNALLRHQREQRDQEPEVPLDPQQYKMLGGYVVNVLNGGASQLDSVDAWAHFRDIPTTTLDMMLARMERDTILTRDPDTPTVFRAGPKLLAQMTAHKLAATKLEGGKKAGTTDTHANDTDNERDQAPKHAKQQQQPAGELEVDDRFGSQQAVMEVTGSEMTGDAPASRSRARRGPGKPQRSPEPAGVFFDDDTLSGATTRTRTRKASFVADPIHQTKRIKTDVVASAKADVPAARKARK